MLPAKHRLRRRRDFDALYRSGRTARGRILTVRVGIRPSGPTRVGFVVSTKVSKAATTRNRIKRQLRHLVAAHLPRLPEHRDIIIQYHGGATVPAQALRQAVEGALAAAARSLRA